MPVQVISSKSSFVATIQLPASKSISNRALILAKVIKQKSGKEIKLTNLSEADDTHILQEALKVKKGTFDIKNAGTCLRFLTAFFAATPGIEVTLTGSERMKERPIADLLNTLRDLGASIQCLEKENALPILISGKKLSGGSVKVSTHTSSQFVSALMLVAPLMEKELILELEGEIVSREYISMTQKVMSQFGIYSEISPDFSKINIGNLTESKLPETFAIEADWSSAAFFYEAVLLADKADILFPGLNRNSIQGDAILADWMRQLGVITFEKNDGVLITKGKAPNEDELIHNFSSYPDLAPAFLCMTASAGFRYKAIGLGSLKYKESNRIAALVSGLNQLHFGTETNEIDEIIHDGVQHTFYKSGTIDTHNDHRICMAFAVVAVFQEKIILSEDQSIVKSFPNFWQEAEKIGINRKRV